METKKQTKFKKLIIIYDGIKNSVFESQVLEPLKKNALQSNQQFAIISFEKNILKASELPATPSNILIIQIKKLPFINQFSLFLDALKLKIYKFSAESIVARGVFGGYIAIKNFDSAKITVQARGLTVQEYDYAYTPSSHIKKVIKKIRLLLFKRLEQKVYQNKNIKIEAVSTALKSFLVKEYNLDDKNICIAQEDIPQEINQEKREAWKKEIRQSLNIPQDAIVYAYSGSTHKWQCPEQTVAFFKKQTESEPNAHLLIMTKDIDQFTRICKNQKISPDRTIFISAPANHVIKTLTAANFGILIREPHIINWVSRPTKALEYKAAGLKILHNDSVEFVKTMQNPI